MTNVYTLSILLRGILLIILCMLKKTICVGNNVWYKTQRNKKIPTKYEKFCGAPGMTRTCGTQIRNLVLYPPELRGHRTNYNLSNTYECQDKLSFLIKYWLGNLNKITYYTLLWGCSSVGRAVRSQRIGQGFESPHLHHKYL